MLSAPHLTRSRPPRTPRWAARVTPKAASVPMKYASGSQPSRRRHQLESARPCPADRRRNLMASPHHEQRGQRHCAAPPRRCSHLLKAIRHDRRLALPGDHLDATIGITDWHQAWHLPSLHLHQRCQADLAMARWWPHAGYRCSASELRINSGLFNKHHGHHAVRFGNANYHGFASVKRHLKHCDRPRQLRFRT